MDKVLKYIRAIGLCVILLVVTYTAKGQFYTGSQMNFGRARLQYNDFLWFYYMFDDFDTYFYKNGKELAQHAAEYAEQELPKIEKMLEVELRGRMQFIVFNNMSDFRQSNVGQVSSDNYNTGGVTQILGMKVFLYFDGDYRNFNQQIRAGIVRIMLSQVMFGSSIGNQVKNNTLLTLPDWYHEGLISFLSEPWNTDIDNRVRDGILTNKYAKYNRLTGDDARYAGHSIWRFIGEKYGRSAIASIVYMARVSRNVEKGFLYVLGVSFKNLVEEWQNYYLNRYGNMADSLYALPESNMAKIKSHRDLVYERIAVSPSGMQIAYVTNELGQTKIWLHDVVKNKRKKIFKQGFKLGEYIDKSYPLITWHPSGHILAYISEENGEVILNFYSLAKKKNTRLVLYDFVKVLSLSYSDDGMKLVMSAVRKGQSDIYVYDIAAGSYEQLTYDKWVDDEPLFINGGKDVFFASNRRSDTLIYDEQVAVADLERDMDLFIYSYSSPKVVLKRVTATPYANERQPVRYSNGEISYLSDLNGIYNRYVVGFDSVIAWVDTTTHYRYIAESRVVTNYNRNILWQGASNDGGRFAEVIFSDGQYLLRYDDVVEQTKRAMVLDQTVYRKKLIKDAQERAQLKSLRLATPPKREMRFRTLRYGEVWGAQVNRDTIIGVDSAGVIDIGNYAFDKQSFIRLGRSLSDTINGNVQGRLGFIDEGSEDAFVIPKQRNYRVEYSVNQLISQVDFAYLNTTYQPFTGGGGPVYLNPGFNVFLQGSVTDLLENYRITGGVRVDPSLVNNEYVLSFANMKRRLDREIVFHRQAVETTDGFSLIRVKTHELKYIFTWPFSEVLNLKTALGIRNDRDVYLSLDQYSLREPESMRNWANVKLDLTYDATRSVGLNLYYGLRFKLFGEYYSQVEGDKDDLGVIGADFRHYLRIHRTFIWANRFAASTSMGSKKLIYYMGGVDNWLFAKFNNDIPIDFRENYGFQTLATNMRGFRQNIRNGNSFFVLNSELRFPLFRYLYNRPIKSDFLNNFQVVGFGDMGTAWTGPGPYSEDNALFVRYINRKPLSIKVEQQIEPVVAGMGLGIRSRLLGYFIRADIAWGLDDWEFQPYQFYLSLSLDF